VSSLAAVALVWRAPAGGIPNNLPSSKRRGRAAACGCVLQQAHTRSPWRGSARTRGRARTLARTRRRPFVAALPRAASTPRALPRADAMASRTMLVYGATGKTGGAVVSAALAASWRVVAYVRSPDKVPATLRDAHPETLSIIQGDLNDSAAVAAAVRACAPAAIVDASSSLPFAPRTPSPPNNADRTALLKATVEALRAEERLPHCALLLVGAQLLPEPGSAAVVFAWVLSALIAPSLYVDAQQATAYLFQEAPPETRFTMLRMGNVDEAPSRGALRPEASEGNFPRGIASACDVGAALVALAGDAERRWERQAICFNYS
jgi:hypothetical protein